ncbi:hypothetical protein ABTQ33_12980 (plasmid) [Paucilactobacillus suebicus]|uniref:hypothetical protein n=1 Tax=Paucilactobacillus suebicus TaxID=152335 RepID=UPI0002490450|nr:hypothetical protein [Paucilactobacillus suebicus]
MEFIDVFGIKHTQCSLLDTKSEYKRVFIFTDEKGQNFVAIKENPEPNNYGSKNMHWRCAKPQDAPINYYFNN